MDKLLDLVNVKLVSLSKLIELSLKLVLSYLDILKLCDLFTGFSEAGADEVGREELTYNQAVAWEYKGDYKKALEILESYDQKYTAEGNAARELAFLKTRQGNH